MSSGSMFADILSQATKLDARITRPQFVRVLESHGLQRDDERLADIMAWLDSEERPLTEPDIQTLRKKSDLVERAFNGNLIVGWRTGELGLGEEEATAISICFEVY